MANNIITPRSCKLMSDLLLTNNLIADEIISAQQSNNEDEVEYLKRVQKVLSSELFIKSLLRAKEYPSTPKGIKAIICESWL